MVEGDKMDQQEVAHAVEQSVQSALKEEEAFLVDAIMRSKADAPVSDEGVVIMRLKRVGHYKSVIAGLLDSSYLEAAVSRVKDSGCELQPDWTPALLLLPLTQTQVEELEVQLSAHHIIALESDKDLVVAALQEIPSRKRPSVAVPPTSQISSVSHNVDSPLNFSAEVVGVEIVNTFIKVPIPTDISEASGYADTAPCGVDSSHQPKNPRRWRGLPTAVNPSFVAPGASD